MRQLAAPSPTSLRPALRVTAHAVQWVEKKVGRVRKVKELSSSQWSTTTRLELESGERFVVKSAVPGGAQHGVFVAEAAGLRAIEATHTLRVPRVVHSSCGEDGEFIVLEFLELLGGTDQAALGRSLAALHSAPVGSRFGFEVDNTIGGTPQPNAWGDDWISFFRDKRLLHIATLTGDATLQRLAGDVAARLPSLFEGITVSPSLLHGDLWSGNIGACAGASGAPAVPCVFDPATYIGHDEAEFGMSWCAGFDARFWEAYHAARPAQPGAAMRRQLYTAYHILNHAVMFGGGGYSTQARSLLEQLAAA